MELYTNYDEENDGRLHTDSKLLLTYSNSRTSGDLQTYSKKVDGLHMEKKQHWLLSYTNDQNGLAGADTDTGC